MVDKQTRAQAVDSTDFFDQAIAQFRKQVWVGILLFWLFGLIITRWLRYNEGVQATPATILMQVALYSVIFTSLWLRKSRHAPATQTVFLALTHALVPIGLFFYGSLQGLGDVALYMTAIVSLLFGWRRWMYATFGFSLLALLYVYYRDFMGQPSTQFLEYTPQVANIKMIFFFGFVAFTIYFGNRFYRQLLERHRQFAEEQVRLTADLQASDAELRQLTDELATSQQQIVTAQEEERVRLRRNLHDDLGPTLAALVFQAGTARNLLPQQPNKADSVLSDLELGIENTLGDVRRFVYALRPPQLDQLGLPGAIREYIKKLNAPLAIELSMPERLDLGAATEVACFNIVQTALEHVVQYRNAQQCIVTITEKDEILTLSICDNGVEGVSNPNRDTILASMRTQAEELTGTITIGSQAPQGTFLQAQLPNTRDINEGVQQEFRGLTASNEWSH